jgi:hypothetical protein
MTMKGYVVLLAVLWLVNVAVRLLSLTHPAAMLPNALLGALYVADVALFTLCLAGSLDAAFGTRLTRRLPAGTLRLAWRATLAEGLLTVLLMGFGDRLGLPGFGPGPGLVSLLLILLPYTLFAAPLILAEHGPGARA